MLTQSKAIRNYIVGVCLSMVPILIVSGVIASFTSPRETGASMLFFIGVILGVSLALWIIGSIIGWAVFALFERERRAEDLHINLLKENFPTPSENESSAEDYFGVIAADESQPIKLRLSARGSKTIFEMLRTFGMMQPLFQLSMVSEDAMRLLRIHRIKAEAK